MGSSSYHQALGSLHVSQQFSCVSLSRSFPSTFHNAPPIHSLTHSPTIYWLSPQTACWVLVDHCEQGRQGLSPQRAEGPAWKTETKILIPKIKGVFITPKSWNLPFIFYHYTIIKIFSLKIFEHYEITWIQIFQCPLLFCQTLSLHISPVSYTNLISMGSHL
jgi:hypothetical protein